MATRSNKMSYVNDLQSAWNRYVVMKSVDVMQVTTPGSPAHEPDFAKLSQQYMCKNSLGSRITRDRAPSQITGTTSLSAAPEPQNPTEQQLSHRFAFRCGRWFLFWRNEK